MATLQDPYDFTAAAVPTAAQWQTLSDSTVQLQGGTPSTGGALDFFSAVQTVAQTGLTASTFVAITFTTEVVDSAAGHDNATNPSRYVPQTAGYVEISGAVAIAGTASGSRRLCGIGLNGNLIGGSQAGLFTGGNSNNVVMAVPTIVQYVNGTTDYIELFGWSDVASWATVISSSATSRLNVRWVHST